MEASERLVKAMGELLNTLREEVPGDEFRVVIEREVASEGEFPQYKTVFWAASNMDCFDLVWNDGDLTYVRETPTNDDPDAGDYEWRIER